MHRIKYKIVFRLNPKPFILFIPAALCLIPVAATAAPKALNGRALFETVCTRCHEPQELLRLKKNKMRWKARILEHQTLLNEPEAEAVASYLVKASGR